MRDTDFIHQMIEQQSFKIAQKIFESQFQDRFLEDQSQEYQDMAQSLVKGWLYDIFLDAHFNADHPNIEWMAEKIHAFTLFKNTKEFKNETAGYQDACRKGALIALDYMLPIIKSSYNISQSAVSQADSRSWIGRTLRSVKDIFANAGG